MLMKSSLDGMQLCQWEWQFLWDLYIPGTMWDVSSMWEVCTLGTPGSYNVPLGIHIVPALGT